MANFGGTMRLTIGGQPRTLRGSIKVNPSGTESEEIVNQDRSYSRSLKPALPGGDVTFEDDGGDWEAVLLMPPANITVVEDQTGAIHTFTGGSFVGKPETDRSNGEVSGLKIICSIYRKVGV